MPEKEDAQQKNRIFIGYRKNEYKGINTEWRMNYDNK